MGMSASLARLLLVSQRRPNVQHNQLNTTNEQKEFNKDTQQLNNKQENIEYKPQTLDAQEEAVKKDVMKTMNLISQNVKASFNTFNK